MKIEGHDLVAWEWRSGRETVGIVVVKDKYIKLLRAYIGVAQGLTEQSDCQHIADWGARLTKEEAMPFFPHLKEDNWE